MEALVRRHFWMDLVHLACRTGPYTFALIFLLSTTAARAELSRGHPAKDHRVIVHSSESTPLPGFELPFLGAPRGAM